MGFLGGLLGTLIPGLIGGAAGAANTRPPALDPTQRGSLDALIKSLMPTATGTPTIDPNLQAYMFGKNAEGLTGANNAITHLLTSRGLGRSGLLGAGLMQNVNQSQVNQGNINQNLLNLGYQQKQLGIQDILGLLNVNNTPGQSGFGGFMAGLAPILAYSIQNMQNQSTGGYNTGPSIGDIGKY